MRLRRATLLLIGAVASGCAPSPQSAAGGEEGSRPTETLSAASFDVGPILTAEAYLEDAQFANADLERGELLSLACVACHTLGAGQDHMLGPNLNGIFGENAARSNGFEYSAALGEAGLVWTPRALDAWLAEPSSFVPGTSMVFAGYSAPDDRRDLIAYLLRATQAPSD